jgi:nitrite reductase (NADH) small subunit
VNVGGRGGVGVFNVGGRYCALRNTCPHQGGPLCRGTVHGTTVVRIEPGGPPRLEWVREGEILRCPWHRWEFDLFTGASVFPSRLRVKTYDVRIEPPRAETFPVRVEDGLVILEVP